jgi:hypothetical protein
LTKSGALQYEQLALVSGTAAPHFGQASMPACFGGAWIVNSVPHRQRPRLPSCASSSSYRASQAGQATITARS